MRTQDQRQSMIDDSSRNEDNCGSALSSWSPGVLDSHRLFHRATAFARDDCQQHSAHFLENDMPELLRLGLRTTRRFRTVVTICTPTRGPTENYRGAIEELLRSY